MMDKVTINDIGERLREAEAMNNDHFDDLLGYIEEIIDAYEMEHS